VSDFAPALAFMLGFEIPSGSYSSFLDACPEGCPGPCMAIAGINSGEWPTDYAAIAALPVASRPLPVGSFYLVNFWNPMGLTNLLSQDMANRVFDEGVNSGSGVAIRLLQEAANALGASLTVDGVLGVLTAAAVNALAPETILTAYRESRAQRYRDIVEDNPANAKYLTGWLARAEA
jgi:Predicted Peptidoglycan domain